MLVTYLDAPPARPARMPSPFGEPHPIARHAAAVLEAQLRGGLARQLALAEDGKMFGVLVVEDRGRIGFLKGFSGMVRGQWHLDGFVPPTFDEDARDAFWPAGECELATIGAEIAALDERMSPLATALAAVKSRQRDELDELRERHRTNREHRHRARAELKQLRCTCTSTCTCHVHVHVHDPRHEHELDQQSRRDTAERRALDTRHAHERAGLESQLDPLVVERDKLDALRSERSRHFLHRIHATYLLPNARGEVRPLGDIFAPATPPGGAGDCAAPKLLAYAYRHGLTPIAFAELWCGAPPATGGRRDGTFYPACRGKCGPLLGHMLAGLDVEPAPRFEDDTIDPREPVTRFEDRWLAIVDKPVGLLSVPGRSATDSVQARLRARYPGATGPLVVHRLDLDTSGLLLVAKDLETHAALQRGFAERTIDKRYVAVLEGEVRGDGGTIDLPLRVDLDDRPRQIVDEKYGKSALTEWHVIGRTGSRTRVAMSPKTGRAHQLRVHAAHPRGIGVPIVGDRLYGRPDARLMLHAASIAFVHPHTHEHLVWQSTPPF
jgi:tRNA pseudouridine32 synthase/23S rRNA pseudouridine746 synthase